MKRAFFLLMLSLATCCVTVAQKPLKQPLAFVSGEQVLLMSPSNAYDYCTRLNPFLHPETVTLSRSEAKRFQKLYRRGYTTENVDTLARLYLVSGDARLIHRLEVLKGAVHNTMAREEGTAATAQLLLNTLSWMAATDERGLYINTFDDCLVSVATDHVRCKVDVISERLTMKYRIRNLPRSGTRLVLRLRLPSGGTPDYYLNGRRILDPKFERGYLVLDREWRDNEEIFFNDTAESL